MYSRAPRCTHFTIGSTTSEVGPGSYDVNHYEAKTSDGYAPFLSLSSRDPSFHRSSNDTVYPGPGQYNSSNGRVICLSIHPPFIHPYDHILGGQTLQNRSKRFEDIVSEVPGPGAYDVRPASGSTVKRAGTHPPGTRGSKVGGRPHLKALLQPDVPSIPSPGQAFGYETDGHGVLCKQKPAAIDDTLGPAFYNPLVAENSFSQKYKGVHFGKMTGKRLEEKVPDGPGPGQYDHDKYSTTKYENINLKKEKKIWAELVIPRYHEMVPLQEEKKGVPGPGWYHIRSQFEKQNHPFCNVVLSPPFLCQAQRFVDLKDLSPPVGVYNDPRCAMEILKKTTGMRKSPFGLTAVRFVPDNQKRSTPGPGAYNVFEYGLAHDSLKKAYIQSTLKGGFGSTAQRSPVFYSKEDVNTPGPGQYRVEKKTEELYKKKHTAAFKSTTERLTMSLVAKDSPPASSYNVQESFEKTYGRASFSEPRSAGGRKRQSSFLSAAKRDSTFLRYDPHIPGPGHYSPEVKSSPQMALIVSREDRFKEPKNTNPGPGTYELMDTVLKGTFNVTLNNRTSGPRSSPMQTFSVVQS
ncbi:hypothetical protein UPYG_G00190170 [Umbra pygmaea]|uniref:Sperm-tail PG-rich repeat-containing protein 2 n=1 Tax=Umbra pygmaea TaxID=75934 RepID=A0ABD0WU46_UMBPY